MQTYMLCDQRQALVTEIDITDDDLDLLLLETEIHIDRTAVSPAQLEQVRADLQRRINYRRSPILHFPPEVLSVIFSSLCAMKIMSPLFLGKICKAWREIIWSDSRLW